MSDEKNASQVGAPIDPVLARASGAWAFEIYEGGIAPSAKPSEARAPEVRFAKLQRVTAESSRHGGRYADDGRRSVRAVQPAGRSAGAGRYEDYAHRGGKPDR